MSTITFDHADLQRALDWAFGRKHLPIKVILKEGAGDLRIELQDLDVHSLVPKFDLELTAHPSMQGEELVFHFKGHGKLAPIQKILNAPGGVMLSAASALGIPIKSRYHEVIDGETILVHPGEITIENVGRLGDHASIDNVSHRNGVLRIDFRLK